MTPSHHIEIKQPRARTPKQRRVCEVAFCPRKPQPPTLTECARKRPCQAVLGCDRPEHQTRLTELMRSRVPAFLALLQVSQGSFRRK